MKRKLIYPALASALVIGSLWATLSAFQTPAQQDKKYVITVTLQEAQNLLSVIEQSNSSYQQVTAVKSLIIGQIEQQLKAEQDTTKKK